MFLYFYSFHSISLSSRANTLTILIQNDTKIVFLHGFTSFFQDFSPGRIVGSSVYPYVYSLGLFVLCTALGVLTLRYNPSQHYPSSTGTNQGVSVWVRVRVGDRVRFRVIGCMVVRVRVGLELGSGLV